MEQYWPLIAGVVTAVFSIGIVATVGSKVRTALSEWGEVLMTIAEAMQDNTITAAELVKVKEEILEAVQATKDVISKKEEEGPEGETPVS